MLFQIWFLISYLTANYALQLNFYATVGQVREEVSIMDGDFQVYFPQQEYNAIVPGTIDFPGQRIIEQDLYNSNENLRNTDIYINFNKCENNKTIKAKLIDPYSLLIKHDSSRYTYVSRDQIQFDKDPLMDGMILSVQLNDSTTTKTTMTYLTRGLSWIPRYEVIVIDDQSATLRALADINNENERSYDITTSQLITGNVPLVSPSFQTRPSTNTQSVEYSTNSAFYPPSSISSEADSTNFGTYSYNITRQFNLLPKSIKTFPFLSTLISFNYTLEATVGSPYYSPLDGIFQRIFTIQPSEFLPAGIITFYLETTGIVLGQGRLKDTPKQVKQRITAGNDAEVRYNLLGTVTSTQQTPTYGQNVNLNVTISNYKDKHTVSATLNINLGGYRNTTIISRTCSSSNINISQDRIDKGILITRTIIKPNENETCMIVLKQWS